MGTFVLLSKLSELSELSYCFGPVGGAHDSDHTWCLLGITVGLS